MRLPAFLAVPLAAVVLCTAVACGTQTQTQTADAALDEAVSSAATYVARTTEAPQCGAVGGEWAVIGLARGGFGSAALFETYYEDLVAYVSAADGVLHRRKYTEYARVVLALTAIGKDPVDVGGYDLLSPLADFDRVTGQGLNGAVFALLALDAGDYAMPAAPQGQTQATREAYLAEILSYATPLGGFSLFADGGEADADITAMALCALAPYGEDAAVQKVTEDALQWLSTVQGEDGGFGSAESNAQVVLALTAHGIDPADMRFVKGGKSPLDALMTYALPRGGYCHAADRTADAMASEQALLALVAVRRLRAGESPLYRIMPMAVADGDRTTK